MHDDQESYINIAYKDARQLASAGRDWLKRYPNNEGMTKTAAQYCT